MYAPPWRGLSENLKKLLPRISNGTLSFQELLVELKINKQTRTTQISGQIFHYRLGKKKFLCNFTVFQINCQLIGGCKLLIVIARQLFLNRFSPLVDALHWRAQFSTFFTQLTPNVYHLSQQTNQLICLSNFNHPFQVQLLQRW